MVYLKKRFMTFKKLLRREKMKLEIGGKNISRVEVLNISDHGFWLMVYEKEYFLSFSNKDI